MYIALCPFTAKGDSFRTRSKENDRNDRKKKECTKKQRFGSIEWPYLSQVCCVFTLLRQNGKFHRIAGAVQRSRFDCEYS